jgi:hypothetical protein
MATVVPVGAVHTKTFWSYLRYRHPLLGLYWKDPDDKLRGYRRRAVILNVFLLAFALSSLKDAIFAKQREAGQDVSVGNDFRELGKGHFTPHLGVSLLVAAALFLLEHFFTWLFAIPTWKGCCQTCWCCICRNLINAVSVACLIVDIILIIVLRENNDNFVGWLWTYSVYALIFIPIRIFFWWHCFAKAVEREKLDKSRNEIAKHNELNAQIQAQANAQQAAQARARMPPTVVVMPLNHPPMHGFSGGKCPVAHGPGQMPHANQPVVMHQQPGHPAVMLVNPQPVVAGRPVVIAQPNTGGVVTVHAQVQQTVLPGAIPQHR